MNLAHTYAAVLKEVGTTEGVDRVLARMKEKGHLSLLPQVAAILERSEATPDTVVTVAKAGDEKKYADQVSEVGGDNARAKVIVDPRIVGNVIVRHRTRLLDASYRRALVSLYQNTLVA